MFCCCSQAIGNAVTCCTPRSLISQSGILPVLAAMLPHRPSTAVDSTAPTLTPTLTQVQVEFLQACLYAQQYRYAESWVLHTWPRPAGGLGTTSSSMVRLVLRYFYLRGTVHIGCANWKWARRCFWTCLSIPSDMVSAIAIAAWKKLVLVHCRTWVDVPGRQQSAMPSPLLLLLSVLSCH